MRLALLSLVLLVPISAPAAAVAADAETLSGFNASDWVAEKWNKSQGSVSFVADTATGTPKALQVQVHFAGKGFEWFTLNPTAPLAVPAPACALGLWLKGGKAGYPVVVKFKDGKGQTKIDGHDLEWVIGDAVSDRWQHRRFELPATWEKPLTIYALAVHNWEHQQEVAEVTYLIDELQVVK